MGALLVAGLAVNALMFAPVALRILARAGDAQNDLPRLLAAQGVRNAVVFHEFVAPPELGATWAYYPPCNPPSLDGDIIYVNLLGRPSQLHLNREFWQRRFPDRTAWYFGRQNGVARLVPLDDLIAQDGRL